MNAGRSDTYVTAQVNAHLNRCALLWVKGKNTLEIAEAIGLTGKDEWAVHNAMKHWMPIATTLRSQMRKETA